MVMKDLVIIGSGPAGLSAAVYGKRALLDEVVIEKEMFSGGQIISTERVDNYLGSFGINGYDLAIQFRQHADSLEVPFITGCVKNIVDKGEYKELLLDNGEVINARYVIIATGAAYRKLGIKGEKELKGAGVSYCATCDGAFFRNKSVAVVGGGDVALEDAIYLSNLCEKVYLIHRREELRGAKILQKEIEDKTNIEFLPFTEVKEICGDSNVERIITHNNQNGEEKALEVAGVFIAIGMVPQCDFINGLVDTDASGYIIASEDCKTSIDGIYAVGDIRTKKLRQIVTAVADGAVAISEIVMPV